MSGRLTLFESRSTLAKRWELTADGKPEKTSAAQMTHGSYAVRLFDDVVELAALLGSVTTHQAVSASLPLDGSPSGEIVTQKMQAQRPGAKARTKQHFGLRPQLGLMVLDHDAAAGEAGFSRDALWQLLCEVLPQIQSAGVLARPSGSSHIFHGEHDQTGARGIHLFVLLADASDGPRVTRIVADRLWLAGHGRVEVSRAGSLLVRCPFDTAVADPARLIFAGGAECIAPLAQRRGPPVILNNGGFLDSLRDVPDLSAGERERVEGLIEQSKAAAMPLAIQRRAEHRGATIAQRLPALMRAGMSAADAEQRIGAAVDAAFGGYLLAEFQMTAVHDDGRREVVTVAEVLADRDRWHGVDVLDPINPEHRGGAPDCRLYLHSASPIAYSLDDGGTVYRLRAAQQRLTVAKGNRGELVQQLAALIAGLDQVFGTDAGPVIVERGRRVPLTVDRLMNLAGSAVTLSLIGAKGQPMPTDLPRETAQLVLAALSV